MSSSFYKILFLISCAAICAFARCKSQNGSCCQQNEFTSYSQISNIDDERFEIDSSINISHVRRRYTENPSNIAFGYLYYSNNNKNYLTYINRGKDSLIFINLIDSNDFHKYPIKLDKANTYNCRIINDTLHLVNNATFVYTQFKINEDFSLSNVFNLDLKKIYNFKGLYLFGNFVIDKNLEYNYPFLVLTYGDFKKKNNAGKSIYLVINVNNGVVKKNLDFPEIYRNCDFRTPYSISEKTDRDHIITIFPKNNELFYWNIQMGSYEGHTINFSSQFMCYSKDMERNLAASNKYDLNDEENSNLIYNSNYIYLIKRLRKSQKNEPPKAVIIVLDKSFKPTSTYYPNQSIWTRMSFPYKKGVLLLSTDASKAYYYGFK